MRDIVFAIALCSLVIGHAIADTYTTPCTGECRTTPRDLVEIESGDSTPTIIKAAVASVMVMTLILAGNSDIWAIERTDRIVKLLPDHRALLVVVDIPIGGNYQ